MKFKSTVFFAAAFLLSGVFCLAQTAAGGISSSSSAIPLAEYDTTAVVPVPSNAVAAAPSQAGSAQIYQDAPEGSQDFPEDEESSLGPVQNPQAAALETPAPQNAQAAAAQEQYELNPKAAEEKDLVRFAANDKDAKEKPLPQGTIAVYIDVEEAFNKNPATIQARKNIKVELESKQIEFIQLKDQLEELKDKEKLLLDEAQYYRAFYEKPLFVMPQDKYLPRQYPQEHISSMLDVLCFGLDAEIPSSPENTPQKRAEVEAALREVRKSIIDKEAFLLNYKALSKEELLSKQDYIVQRILKEIYSGIKEYSALRNISVVVDKRNLIYGKPLDITPEFIKWMKSYHKKYQKENGEIL